jgi:membrane dipeptidase
MPAGGVEPTIVTPQAYQLHQESLLFDGHNNLLRALLKRSPQLPATIDLQRHQSFLHTDFPRLRQGGVGAEYFAIYVSSDSVKKGTAVRETLEQIDALKSLLARYPDTWGLATSSEELLKLRGEGKVAGVLALENGAVLDGSLAMLRHYHELGVRCLAVTHDDSHAWADAALDRPLNQGLSDFGKSVISESNRLGIVLDLAHASEKTIRDTLEISRSPITVSHAGAAQLAPHPRNLSDELLEQIGKRGGVIHVNFFPAFLTSELVAAYARRSEQANAMRKKYKNEQEFLAGIQTWLQENPLPATSVSNVVDHIDHIVKVAGIDAVGLGSNFDGIVSVPADLHDVSCFPRITQELLNRGYTPDQIRKILGGNALRVMQQVERMASDLPVAQKR